MREILFRGKRIDNGKWVEGGIIQGVAHELWQNSDKVYIMVFPQYLSRPNLYEVDPTTVGQYTGLTDKNGNRAFEHDITKDQWGRKWIIFGCKGGFGTCIESEWKNNSPIIYNALADAQNAEWFSKQYEIIGTIYDNSELLKEEPT